MKTYRKPNKQLFSPIGGHSVFWIHLCFEFTEGRVMHPVSSINVYMSLAVAKYLFIPK